MAVDTCCALAAGLVAFEARFGDAAYSASSYLLLTLVLPLIWVTAVAVAGGYDSRFIGVGSDEFRRVLNAGVGLTAAVAVAAYASNVGLARGYVVLALPVVTVFDLMARLALRKRLHALRSLGSSCERSSSSGIATSPQTWRLRSPSDVSRLVGGRGLRDGHWPAR